MDVFPKSPLEGPRRRGRLSELPRRRRQRFPGDDNAAKVRTTQWRQECDPASPAPRWPPPILQLGNEPQSMHGLMLATIDVGNVGQIFEAPDGLTSVACVIGDLKIRSRSRR
jgi:hypothetical protein